MSHVDKVKAEYESNLVKAEQLDAIEAKLPAGAKYVHISPLYGTIACAKFGDHHKHDEPISLARAVELVELLPPVSLTMVKDSCLSIRPSEYVESLPEDKKEHWKQESPISSVTLTIDALHDYAPKCSFEWMTRLDGIGLVRIEVCLSESVLRTLGRYDSKKRKIQGETVYDRTQFAPVDKLHTVQIDGESVAQLESPIVWASGSRNNPNNLTLYFVDLGADANPAVVGLAIVSHIADLASVL